MTEILTVTMLVLLALVVVLLLASLGSANHDGRYSWRERSF